MSSQSSYSTLTHLQKVNSNIIKQLVRSSSAGIILGVALPLAAIIFIELPNSLLIFPGLMVLVFGFAFFQSTKGQIETPLPYQVMFSLLPSFMISVLHAMVSQTGDILLPVYLLEAGCAILPFVFFGLQQKGWLIGTSIVNLALFASFPWLQALFSLETEYPALHEGSLNIALFVIAIINAMGILFSFTSIREQSRKEMESLSSQISTKDQEIDIAQSEYHTNLEKLKHAQEEERSRKWISDGLSVVYDLVRTAQNDEDIYDRLISQIVNYIKGNQGAIFIRTEDFDSKTWLQLRACYAYQRKKFIEARFEPGQGLIGQVYLEGEYVHMTHVPQDYMKITSGLGEARPDHLLVVPMKVDDEVVGIVELASFSPFTQEKISWMHQVCEVLASFTKNQQVVEKTQKLLETSSQQAEALRANEEELRQNMEEVSATQEEMQRILQQVRKDEKLMQDMMDSTSDTIFILDTEYRFIRFNKTLHETWMAQGINVQVGDVMLDLFDEKSGRKEHKAVCDRVIAGEFINMQNSVDIGGKELIMDLIYSPIKNDHHEVVAIAIFGKDITDRELTHRKNQELLMQSQQQGEEMRAQEEELLQNMEELSATQDEMQKMIRRMEREERFMKDLLDSTNDIVFTIDKNYCLVKFNKAFYQTWKVKGYDLQPGVCILDLHDEKPAQFYKSQWDKVFLGEYISQQMEVKIADEIHYMDLVFAPLSNEDNEIIGCSIFAKDVTDKQRVINENAALLEESQRRAEELEAQEGFLRSHMEELTKVQNEMIQKQEEYSFMLQRFELASKTISEGLWDMVIPESGSVDEHTAIWYSNQIREKLGFKNEQDFPNQMGSWSSLIHPKFKAKLIDALQKHLTDTSGKTPFDQEYLLKMKDGKYHWFKSVGQTQRKADGTPVRVAGSLIDIQLAKEKEENRSKSHR